MKTPLELVKSKVQEACPDVMNLEFGCRIINKQLISEFYDGQDWLVRPLGSRDMETGIDENEFTWETVCGYEVETDECEILGREIRLADVLRTIEKKSADYSIDTSGRFIRCSEEWIRDPESKLAIYWDLSHDSLSWHAENRPETVALLAEVLK